MQFGAGIFFTDYSARAGELARELEDRGFEIALGAGTLAYSDFPGDADAGRQGPAQEIL